jgi:CRISPR/Cas system-associated endoribonuclease Cas2
MRRIQKGIANGTLTPEEAKGLAQKQAAIAQAETQALADGKLDKKEFKQLRKMQKEASRDIFEQKHNSTEQPVAEADRASHLEGFQKNQSGRVQNGLSDGSLTTGEAGGLMDQLNRIAETKGKAMADGKIDDTEYNQLRELQREASISIFKARHNDGIRA